MKLDNSKMAAPTRSKKCSNPDDTRKSASAFIPSISVTIPNALTD